MEWIKVPVEVEDLVTGGYRKTVNFVGGHYVPHSGRQLFLHRRLVPRAELPCRSGWAISHAASGAALVGNSRATALPTRKAAEAVAKHLLAALRDDGAPLGVWLALTAYSDAERIRGALSVRTNGALGALCRTLAVDVLSARTNWLAYVSSQVLSGEVAA